MMKVHRCVKESFVVIGKEGSTLDGEGFIQRLWIDANSHFGEVQHLAKLEDNAIPLVGAVHDFICPQTGKNYMFFPIRKL